MSEVTISLEGHAEELAVFGSRDQYLRQIRDAVGVKVLARHGEVRIEGDPDRIEQARRIFEGLRSILPRAQGDRVERRQRVDRRHAQRCRSPISRARSRFAKATGRSGRVPTGRRGT